jgi:hypothetical protein
VEDTTGVTDSHWLGKGNLKGILSQRRELNYLKMMLPWRFSFLVDIILQYFLALYFKTTEKSYF